MRRFNSFTFFNNQNVVDFCPIAQEIARHIRYYRNYFTFKFTYKLLNFILHIVTIDFYAINPVLHNVSSKSFFWLAFI